MLKLLGDLDLMGDHGPFPFFHNASHLDSEESSRGSKFTLDVRQDHDGGPRACLTSQWQCHQASWCRRNAALHPDTFSTCIIRELHSSNVRIHASTYINLQPSGPPPSLHLIYYPRKLTSHHLPHPPNLRYLSRHGSFFPLPRVLLYGSRRSTAGLDRRFALTQIHFLVGVFGRHVGNDCRKAPLHSPHSAS